MTKRENEAYLEGERDGFEGRQPSPHDYRLYQGDYDRGYDAGSKARQYVKDLQDFVETGKS